MHPRACCRAARVALFGVMLLPAATALLLANACGGEPARTVTVFNAGSLASPIGAAARAFERTRPGVRVLQESSGSLEAARKLTELGKVPDVLAVADEAVLEALIEPAHAGWHAVFATNAMVLLRRPGAPALDSTNWVPGLLQPGMRIGRADPVLDPNGYRALMVLQLAELEAGEPGLAARLLAVMPDRYMRPKEAELTALVEAGELDYAWSYRSIAVERELPHVALGAPVDLGDPARAAGYARASVRLPGARIGGDSVEIRGAPIAYAVTVPRAAPNAAGAIEFVRFLLSPEGREALASKGLLAPPTPRFGGPEPPPPALRGAVAPTASSR
jgi:molybdate/tungstate transport system substrate-binding protein